MEERFSKLTYFDMKAKAPAFRGHVTRIQTRLSNALNKDDLENVKVLNEEFQKKLEVMFSLIDSMDVKLLDEEDDKQAAESAYMTQLSDALVEVENDMQAKVDAYSKKQKAKQAQDQAAAPGGGTQAPVVASCSSGVKLAGISPPSWSGNKAEPEEK